MRQKLLRRYFLLLLVIVVLMLAGCQRVSDARTEFCDTLHDVGALATDFKSAKVDDRVDKFGTKMDTLRAKKETLDRLAELAPGPTLEKLATTVDEAANAVDAVSGKTLGPAAEKINVAGVKLESIYQELNDAMCAAK